MDIPLGAGLAGAERFSRWQLIPRRRCWLATADGNLRAVGYLSRLPEGTLMSVRRNAFYAGLLSAQGQPRGLVESVTGLHSYTALLAAARADVRRMDIGWVIDSVPECAGLPGQDRVPHRLRRRRRLGIPPGSALSP